MKKEANNLVNQSILEANTSKWREAPENMQRASHDWLYF